MPLTLVPLTAATATERKLIDEAAKVSVPTLGHYLEAGFVDPAISRFVGSGSGTVAGRAVTLRLAESDSTLLHHTVSDLGEYDILIISAGDNRHAPVGEVIGHALATRGARAVVIDGVCTDIDALREIGVPVYSRGTSALTTKFNGIDDGAVNTSVVCGGVVVNPGDIVLADSNGVVVLAPDVLRSVLVEALADDASEPTLIAELYEGKRLGILTGATELIEALRA